MMGRYLSGGCFNCLLRSFACTVNMISHGIHNTVFSTKEEIQFTY